MKNQLVVNFIIIVGISLLFTQSILNQATGAVTLGQLTPITSPSSTIYLQSSPSNPETGIFPVNYASKTSYIPELTGIGSSFNGRGPVAEYDSDRRLKYDPYSFIIELEPGINLVGKGQEYQSGSASLVESLNRIDAYIEKLGREIPGQPVFVKVSVLDWPLDENPMTILRNTAGIRSVNHNYYYYTTQASAGGSTVSPVELRVNDPLVSQQWYHASVDTTKAWLKEQGKHSVIIAILDTGVEHTHEDLAPNIWSNPGEIPNNGIDDEGNGFVDDVLGYDFVSTTNPYCIDADCLNEDANPMDSHGHGTHVAGIAAAAVNNRKGGAGVCPGCTIMPVRVGYKLQTILGAGGNLETADIIQGIDYAVANGADIINMSFGSTISDTPVNAKLTLANQNGVILVASAGNAGTSFPGYPAALPLVISVGAMDSSNKKAVFSNHGITVDVAAPGVDILSTHVGNSYISFSGTSMASPIVAGVAGLIISKYGNVNPDVMQSTIMSGVKTFENDYHTMLGGPFFGNGNTNANRVLELMALSPDTIALIQNDSTSNGVNTHNPFATVTGSNVATSTMKLYDVYGTTPYYPSSTKTGQVLGLAYPLNIEAVPNGLKMVRLEVKDASGKVLRSQQKPTVDVKNFNITSPVNGGVVSNAAPVTFSGTISGPNLTHFHFEWSTDGQNYQSTGFVYPNGNSSALSGTIAVWNSPIPPQNGILYVRIIIDYQIPTYGAFSQTHKLAYTLNTNIPSGWPIQLAAQGNTTGNPFEINSPGEEIFSLSKWDTDNDGKDEILFGMATAQIGGSPSVHKDAKIYSFTPNGTIAPGWPVTIPTTVSNGYKLTPQWFNPLSIGDLDGDGSDDVVITVYYESPSPATENYFQTALFAYNKNGVLLSGFPIITHFPPDFGFQFFNNTAPIITDMDGDGDEDVVVYTSPISDQTFLTSLTWIADIAIFTNNGAGAFTVSNIKYTFPAYTFQGLAATTNLAPQGFTVLNVDADPQKEIFFNSGWATSVFGVTDGSMWLTGMNIDGTTVPGWPKEIGSSVPGTTSYNRGVTHGKWGGSPALALMEFRGGPTLYSLYLNVFNPNGTHFAGSPFFIESISSANVTNPSNPNIYSLPTPIFTDVDGDGQDEIMVSNLFGAHPQPKVFALKPNGTNAAGWPKSISSNGTIPGNIPIQATNGPLKKYLLSTGSPVKITEFDVGSPSEVNSYPLTTNPLAKVGGPLVWMDGADSKMSVVHVEPDILGHPIYTINTFSLPSNFTNGDWGYYLHDLQRTNSKP